MKALIFFADGVDGLMFNDYVQDHKSSLLTQFHENSCISLAEKGHVITDSSFVSIYTGLPYNTHKFGFMSNRSWKHRNQSILNRNLQNVQKDTACRFIWDYMEDEGYKVSLFALPMTYPAFSISGFMISGFPFPTRREDKICYPIELLSNYDDFIPPDQSYAKRRDKSLRDVINDDMQLVDYCLAQRKTDILFYYQHEYDSCSHRALTYSGSSVARNSNNINEVFSNLEYQVQWMFDTWNPDNFFLISDHGFAKKGGGHHFPEGIFAYIGSYSIQLPKEINNYNVLNQILDILNIAKTPEERIENQLKAMGYIDDTVMVENQTEFVEGVEMYNSIRDLPSELDKYDNKVKLLWRTTYNNTYQELMKSGEPTENCSKEALKAANKTLPKKKTYYKKEEEDEYAISKSE